MMRAFHSSLTHLAHPQALFLLGLFPLLWVLGIVAHIRRKRALTLLGSKPALRSLTAVGRWRRVVVGLLHSLGFAVLIVAIAGPQWGYDPEPALATGRDLVIVLDVSRSMLAQDMQPSRLGWSQQALAELIDDVQRRGGHRLGLVAFAGQARVLCPLTPDYDHFREALRNLDPADPLLAPLPREDEPASGTRIGAALVQAVQLHESRFRDFQDILLLSDGDDPAHDDEWQAGVVAARQAGIPIHTVGIGNPQAESEIPDAQGRPLRHAGTTVQTHLHEKPLEDIARWTGGTYLPAWNLRRPLSAWLRSWVQQRPGRDLDDDPLPALKPRYPWFFGAALALFGLALLMSDRPRQFRAANPQSTIRNPQFALIPLVLLLIAAGAALDAENLVRLGNEAFERGDFALAIDHFTRAEDYSTDPGLIALNKAAALYRLGRYREAELHYLRTLEDATGERRVRSLYDLGNALVHECQGNDAAMLDRAIGYYEQCLKEPAISEELQEDAQHNLHLARILRERAKKARKDRPSRPNKWPHSEEDPPPQSPADPGFQVGADGRDAHGRPQQASPGNAGQDGAAQSAQRQPGTGNLPPVPDTDELMPLAPEDALAHLQRATQQIMSELQKQKLQHTRPTRNVLDW